MDLNIEIFNFPDFVRDGEASCAKVDPELFFPEDNEDFSGNSLMPGSYRNLAIAKDICRKCPLISGCLEYAIKESIPHGVWGGTTPRERSKLRRRIGSYAGLV